jgi:hypothetical protein
MQIRMKITEASATWWALKGALEVYEQGLASRYDGDPRFGPEDVAFLNEQILRTKGAMEALIAAGYRPEG